MALTASRSELTPLNLDGGTTDDEPVPRARQSTEDGSAFRGGTGSITAGGFKSIFHEVRVVDFELGENVYTWVIYTLGRHHRQTQPGEMWQDRKELLSSIIRLFFNYNMQVMFYVYIKEVVKEKVEEDPERLTTRVFDDTKISIFLTIFALSIFSAMHQCLDEIKVICYGKYYPRIVEAKPRFHPEFFDLALHLQDNNNNNDVTKQSSKAMEGKDMFDFWKKILCLCLVTVPEMILFFTLLFMGSQYIVVSDNIETMIMKIVALAFVKDFDEMIHQAVQQEKPPAFRVGVVAQGEGKVLTSIFYYLSVSFWPYFFYAYLSLEETTSHQVIPAMWRFAPRWPMHLALWVAVVFCAVAYGVKTRDSRHGVLLAVVLVVGLVLAMCVYNGFVPFLAFMGEYPLNLVGLLVIVVVWLMCFGCASCASGQPLSAACCSLLTILVLLLVSFGAQNLAYYSWGNWKHLAKELYHQQSWNDAYDKMGMAHSVDNSSLVWEVLDRCPRGLKACELDSKLCIDIDVHHTKTPIGSAYAKWCPVARSARNCTGLGWDVTQEGNGKEVALPYCSGTFKSSLRLTHADARASCTQRGTRLCRPLEMEALGTSGWSAEPCGTGYWRRSADGAWSCVDVDDTTDAPDGARCCADLGVEAWPCSRNPNGHTCTWTPCASSLGPTHCEAAGGTKILGYNLFASHLCICAGTHCAHEDKCVKPTEHILRAQARFQLVKRKAECKAEGSPLGSYTNVLDCATEVKKAGGRFFVYDSSEGAPWRINHKGDCVLKRTANSTCVEGFEGKTYYDFYELVHLGGA